MNRLDRMDKRILEGLHHAVDVDIDALARSAGCLPEVARDRLERLRKEGVIDGFRPQIAPEYLPAHELMVVGVPTKDTTKDRIAALGEDPFVNRVFTLAAHASVAFTVRGDEPATLRKHAARLAKDAGLEQHQAILVVAHFHDDPEAGTAWRQMACAAVS